jgi:hypothetical protein
MRPGPRNLITDVPGLRVGNAGDARLKSGVTVLTADAPFVAGVDVRGGAPGTRETDLLKPGRLVAAVDALVLAGGSVFGLDAASGVADRLRALGRGFAVGRMHVPIVPGAILFDLSNGGDKAWTIEPPRQRDAGHGQSRSHGRTSSRGAEVRQTRSAWRACGNMIRARGMDVSVLRPYTSPRSSNALARNLAGTVRSAPVAHDVTRARCRGLLARANRGVACDEARSRFAVARPVGHGLRQAA